MSAHFERGLVLFSQNRFDLATREFRQALAQDPDNPLGHALLALCLAHEDDKEQSLREADEAVRLGPDQAFCHYARGRILMGQERLKEAEAAAIEARRLDPDDAEFCDLIGGIHVQRRNWREALQAAEEGLALDPDHAGCVNLRALALVNLGRKDEAAQALHSALANDPENSLTHANQGWALLHRGDHAKALEHFREALRIDPENEWARNGIIEALKARHFLYRVMLRFFLWMGRQGDLGRWAFILAILFGQNILASVSRSNPKLAPILLPLLLIVFGFLMLTWIASPLFNLLLRLNRFGRLALSSEQRSESSWIGGFFFLAVASLIGALTVWQPLIVFAIYFGLLVFPLVVTFQRAPGRPRHLMAGVTLIIALLGVPLLCGITFGTTWGLVTPAKALELFGYFKYGAILSTWAPALLSLQARTR
jgi:tetratricopeptide (TPR) repeat protein